MASGFSRTRAGALPVRPARPASAGPRLRLPLRADDAGRIAELEGFIRESRFKEVEPLLAEYVKQRPASSWGWYALGYSLFAQQKIGESIKALAKSLELDIRNAEAHKILGRNLMIIGRFDAAQVEFEQALRYKPDSAEAHYNLGKLFSVQDNWEPARKAFESALRIDPSYIEALDALGFALEALGDDPGAIAKYEKAIELNAGARRQLQLRSREPERVLQSHGRSRTRRSNTPVKRSSSIRSPIGRGSRRDGRTSGKGAWTRRWTRSTRRSPSTRGPLPITTCWRLSTGVSA